MIVLRKAEERGKANYGWLDARYTFSSVAQGALKPKDSISNVTVIRQTGAKVRVHRDVDLYAVVTLNFS